MNQPQGALSPAESTRLIEFARACKAAARVVTLYPSGHPAIATTLGRIAELTSADNLSVPLKINVLVDNLMFDGQPIARGDAAITELAALLHEHLIGELTVHAGGDVEAWRAFLLLLGRSSESVRAEGGISQVWTTMAGRHVELREIDYAEVLRERRRGDSAGWEQVIANCLRGDAMALDDDTIRELLEATGDPGTLAHLMSALEAKATETGHRSSARAAALIRLLQGIVDAVRRADPDRLEPVMGHLATAVGHLSPDMIVSLLTAGSGAVRVSSAGETTAPAGDEEFGAGIVSAVVDHMADSTIAGFVARNALAQDSSIERVAHAFQSLVRDVDQRERLLALAHDDARSSPLGSTEGFEEVWDQVAQKMMTSYSDKPFVSEQYGRELTAARTYGIDVEQLKDDPPERRTAWLDTVATNELRAMDLTLVRDLLRIEERPERWGALMRPVVALLEDLFLVGDIDAAESLLAVLVRETQPQASPERRQTALIAIDVLVAGPMMQHIVAHLATLDDTQFERVKEMCVSIGAVLIRPLTDALSSEERSRPRERLTTILLTFGAVGRRDMDRLKNSPNAGVRRTAIHLLREFGGSEALTELTELINDKEPQVQRDAVRAIMVVGSQRAFQILHHALTTGSAASREAIMHSLGTVRDERAAPLFAHIVRNVDHRGELASIYLRAIETLGALKDPEGVPALKEALYRGEWWRPRRTAVLRGAAAAALARIGTSAASDVLDEVMQSGPRRLRSAVRPHVAALRRASGDQA